MDKFDLTGCDESGTTRAYQIEVRDIRYHDTGEELVLNDQAFADAVAAQPENFPNDASDLKMTIVATQGDHSNIYLVNQTSSTVVDAANETITP